MKRHPFCRLPLYQAIFTSFRQCLIERKLPVLLPGVMMKGQAQVQVTLHQHVCVHLCASVAALPSKYFSVLVRSIHFQSCFLVTNLNKFFLFQCFSQADGSRLQILEIQTVIGFSDLFSVAYGDLKDMFRWYSFFFHVISSKLPLTIKVQVLSLFFFIMMSNTTGHSQPSVIYCRLFFFVVSLVLYFCQLRRQLTKVVVISLVVYLTPTSTAQP